MKLSVVICPLLLLFSSRGIAVDRTFIVVTNAQILNHWPAADGFVGTADDVVSAQFSKFAGSTPNSYGTYSFIVTSLGFSNEPDPFLPAGNDTATFVLGSVTIDTGAVLGQVPLLKSLEFSGTDLFPGHGAYTIKVTNRRSGTNSRQGNAISFSTRFDFEGQFEAGPARATNALADGIVVLVDAQDFSAPDLSGAPNLADYVNTVALPLARTAGASGLLCGKMKLTTTGSVPGTTGSFPPLNTDAVVLALEFASAATDLLITSIEATPNGARIRWTPVAGKLYTVEATGSLGSPFTPVASNLSVTEYLDAEATFLLTRYYRIRAD